MRAEATLGADSNTLEGLLSRLTAALGNKVGCLVDALLDFLLVFELAQLSADGADDDRPVFRQEFEGLEAAGALRVVLEVEGVNLEVGEELLGDDVISALCEVAATDEVAAAQMDASVEVGGKLADAVVVEGNVGVKEVVDRANVVRVLGPALTELVGAEV